MALYFPVGNGKRGCLADVANMEQLCCPSVPSPLRRSAVDHGIWFSGEPGCSLWILPSTLCRSARPPPTVSYHWHKMEPRAQGWCCPSPAHHVGFSGTPHWLPWTPNSTCSHFGLLLSFPLLNMNSKLAETLIIVHKQIFPSVGLFFI